MRIPNTKKSRIIQIPDLFENILHFSHFTEINKKIEIEKLFDNKVCPIARNRRKFYKIGMVWNIINTQFWTIERL